MAPWTKLASSFRDALTVKERYETPPGSLINADRVANSSIFAKIDPANDAPTTDLERIRAVSSSPIAMACVRKIAWNAASVKFGVEFLNGDLDFEHPLAQRIAKPNSEGGRWGLIQLLTASLAVCGRAYCYGLRSPYENSAPQALIFLRPDHIMRRWNADGTLQCYQYSTGYRGVVDLDPSTVCEIKHPWIGDDSAIPGSGHQEAYSQVTAAWSPLTMYQGLSGLIRKLLYNNGGLPGILTWEGPSAGAGGGGGTELSNTQRDSLREYIQQFRSDGERFGQIGFLDTGGGKVNFIKITEDFKSFEVEKGKTAAMHETCSVFGVPPLLLLGTGEGATFANMAEARRSFWMETVIPGYVDVISEALSNWFGVKIKADLTAIPALADYKMTLAQSVAVMDYLTINEKRTMMGFQNVLGGDVLMVNPVMLPINRLINSQSGSIADEADWLQNQEALRTAIQTGIMPGSIKPSQKSSGDRPREHTRFARVDLTEMKRLIGAGAPSAPAAPVVTDRDAAIARVAKQIAAEHSARGLRVVA